MCWTLDRCVVLHQVCRVSSLCVCVHSCLSWSLEIVRWVLMRIQWYFQEHVLFPYLCSEHVGNVKVAFDIWRRIAACQSSTGILVKCSTPVPERRLRRQRLNWDLLQEIMGRITPGTPQQVDSGHGWSTACEKTPREAWAPQLEFGHGMYSWSWKLIRISFINVRDVLTVGLHKVIGWGRGSPAACIRERCDFFQTRSIQAQVVSVLSRGSLIEGHYASGWFSRRIKTNSQLAVGDWSAMLK